MTKQTKIAITSIFFLMVAILHVFGILNSDKLAVLTKPLIITSLVIVYLVSVKKPNFWYVSALFFSFWGDVLLIFKNDFFVFGLASFLLAHIFYIKITASMLQQISTKKIILVSMPFVLFVIAFISLIKDNLANFFIPVILYAVVISTFGTIALLNYLKEKSTSNLWLCLGAIIFIISDSLIALNKFYEPKYYYSICIMITYIVAQYLICKAIIAKNVFQQ